MWRQDSVIYRETEDTNVFRGSSERLQAEGGKGTKGVTEKKQGARRTYGIERQEEEEEEEEGPEVEDRGRHIDETREDSFPLS